MGFLSFTPISREKFDAQPRIAMAQHAEEWKAQQVEDLVPDVLDEPTLLFLLTELDATKRGGMNRKDSQWDWINFLELGPPLPNNLIKLGPGPNL